jgi:hypothetical protein
LRARHALVMLSDSQRANGNENQAAVLYRNKRNAQHPPTPRKS